MENEEFSMKNHLLKILSVLFLLVGLAACGTSASAVPSVAEEPTITSTVSETQMPSAPTDTAGATVTPGLTSTPTGVPADCYRAKFVADVTIPDGWETAPGTAFTKTWTLMNTGTCAWTSAFALVFDHGDRMDAPLSQTLPAGTVAPGTAVDLSVNLQAPGQPGSYQTFFKMQSPDGVTFGIGEKADTAFWVKITVRPDGGSSTDAPDLQVVSDTAGIPPNDMGVVHVECPAGTVVTGGGFSASNDLVVNGQTLILNSWQAWAVNTGAAARTLTVYAVCIAHPDAETKITLQNAPTSNTRMVTATAACPAGSVLTSGGYYTNSDGSARVFHNAFGATGWTTSAQRFTDGTLLLSANAICLSGVPADVVSAASQEKIAPGEKGFAEISCPAGSGVAGGGWIADSYLVIVTASPLDGVWRVYAKNTGTQTQALQAQAVCLSTR
jgi:hypothetical protein